MIDLLTTYTIKTFKDLQTFKDFLSHTSMAMECVMNVNDSWKPSVCIGLWEDDLGNPCVYLMNKNNEYLSCHEDGKHIYWTPENPDIWSWEMWYPEVVGEHIYLKSYHDTYMVHGEGQDLWQTDEQSNVYIEDFDMGEFEKLMNGDATEDSEENTSEPEPESQEEDSSEPEPEPESQEEDSSEPEPEPEPVKKTKKTPPGDAYNTFVKEQVKPKKAEKKEKDPDAPKKTMSDDQKMKLKVGRILTKLFNEKYQHEFVGLDKKVKTEKLKAKKKEYEVTRREVIEELRKQAEALAKDEA